MSEQFVKLAELSTEDKKKIKNYWAPLWGSEFAKALTEDYVTSGEKEKSSKKD